MQGALATMNPTAPIKSISAVKRYDRAKKKRGGENVLWKRVTASFDDAVKRFAANPEIGSPITRLVFFKHLTVTEGMAARRYGDIMRRFERYHVAPQSRTARSQSFEPARGEDQELQRRILNGTMDDYEADARQARRHYNRLMKVVGPFSGAKDILDQLCLMEIEPPAEWRPQLAAVLRIIAKEFGVQATKGKR